jgi:hypothetical protein
MCATEVLCQRNATAFSGCNHLVACSKSAQRRLQSNTTMLLRAAKQQLCCAGSLRSGSAPPAAAAPCSCGAGVQDAAAGVLLTHTHAMLALRASRPGDL